MADKNNHADLSLAEKNSKQNLNAQEDDKSSVWSNAFNFNKSWGTEIDPRTGMLIVYFKVGSMLSNLGHGPDINLQMNYSSNTTLNQDGLGQGWSWNLTYFNPVTNQLTTSNGQNFYLQQTEKNHWQPLYHKLNDIRIDGDKSSHFVITETNGLRETLSHEGYETRLEQQDGRGVSFLYTQGTHLLKEIVDDDGNKIILSRNEGYLDISSHNDTGQPVTVQIKIHNNQPRRIMFLLKDLLRDSPKIHIHYKGHLITHINYPGGLIKTFAYNCSSDMKLPLLPASATTRALCVVSLETINPGAGQPQMKTIYTYSATNANKHDYLAYNSGLAFEPDTKKDILFEAPVNYTYQTMIDNGITKEIRTYNKYHLQIDNKLISSKKSRILSETQNYFCSTTNSTKGEGDCAQTSFKDLPPTYSLPLKEVTRIWDTVSSTPTIITTTETYDDFGRIASSTDSYGRVTRINYCPQSGDAACPASPEGWLFSMLPESTTLYPAHIANLSSPPAITTYNYYRKMFNRNGKGYILVLDHQMRQASHQQIMMRRSYYDNQDNALTYGLLKQTVLTGTTEHTSTLQQITHDYRYTESIDGQTKTTYGAIELEQGKLHKLSSVTTSLFTNQVIERTDPSGQNVTRYHYDIFGRLIRTDMAIGTPFSSAFHYQYTLSPEHNQVIIRGTNGLQKKITFDNLGRELAHFNQAISASGIAEPGRWTPQKEVSYDAYGRITEQKSYIIAASDHINALKTTKDYDDMARLSDIHLPDGEIIFMLYDNAKRCAINYRQSNKGENSAISVVLKNILGKTIEKRLFPVIKNELPPIKILCNTNNTSREVKISTTVYDGFDRPVIIKDPKGRIVHRNYDALGHLSDITDHTGNTIHKTYNLAEQITERWALPASGGRYLLSSINYNAAGQVVWKTTEDGKKTTFTYTENGQPATAITPANHKFSWKYNILNLPVARYLDDKLLLQSDYDPITARVVKKSDVTGVTTWIYSVDGLPKQLTHIGKNNYPDYQLFWNYDRSRRIINSSDISGNMILIQYDSLGRTAALRYQSQNDINETLFVPAYDGFSRAHFINYGSGMHRLIHYDAYGRRSEVTDTLTNKLLFQWQFDYDANDNITTIRKQAENNQQAVLNYQYDALNNLMTMTCKGNADLSLCPRDTSFRSIDVTDSMIITQQNYTFTALNRISQVKEKLQFSTTKQTINKVMAYDYDNKTVPLRLQKIATTWNNGTTFTRNISYDVAGNMTTDGEGNFMTYNAFNQITNVIKPNGEQSNYSYDGSGKLVMEKMPENTRYLFYRNEQLINEKSINQQNNTHVIGYQVMAKTIDGVIHEYEESNYKGDVTGILTKVSKNGQYRLNQRNIYSPYGMAWKNFPVPVPRYQQNLMGFNGEYTDPATGWQFLGAGHRTYNPKQRYFVSEDPAGDGYAFCGNNPIMYTDPTGNMPKWLQTTTKVMGYIGTFGMSAIHKKWATIMGLSAQILVSLTAFGVMIVSEGSDFMSMTIMAVGTVSLGANIPAAVVPSNKGLNIFATVLGFTQTVVALTSGMFMLGVRTFTSPAASINTTFNMLSLDNSVSSISLKTAEVSNFIDESSAQTAVSTLLREHLPSSIISKSGKDFLAVEDLYNVGQIRSILGANDNDTGTILIVAMMKGCPINIEKLQTFLNVKSEITSSDNMASLSAFKDLMADFSTPTVVAENAVLNIKDMISGSNNAAVIISNKNVGLVQWKAGNNLLRMQFNNNGSFRSIEGDYSQILRNFSDQENMLIIHEYYRL